MTEEVKLAIKHGYKITKLYSILHWDKIEQYNEETCKYIFKNKTRNSGYPSWCQCESDKLEYICVNEGLSELVKVKSKHKYFIVRKMNCIWVVKIQMLFKDLLLHVTEE